MFQMKNYLIAKILFTIFSTTTVGIFFLLYTGSFVDMVGSVEAATLIYGFNIIFLIPATLWYIIERSRKSAHENDE